jgi:hypothetical protein
MIYSMHQYWIIGMTELYRVGIVPQHGIS